MAARSPSRQDIWNRGVNPDPVDVVVVIVGCDKKVRKATEKWPRSPGKKEGETGTVTVAAVALPLCPMCDERRDGRTHESGGGKEK